MSNDYMEENGSTANGEGQVMEPNEEAYQEILTEIDKQQSRQKSWVKNLVILAVSLLIFFQLGLFEGGLHSVAMIILVLLVHETGHLLGMRFFGYRNVQMFFIPFFGAAVSGESRNVAAYKEAIVSLLGPLPGVVIGCVLLFMFAATGQQFYFRLATMFLFINVFNLLPFYPLDGGRFLHTVLFSRNQYLELCFRIFAALALILVGYALGAWLLAILGLVNLLTVRIPFKLAKVAQRIRQSEVYRSSFAGVENGNIDSETIPLSIGKVIIDKVYDYFPPPVDIKTVAGYTKQVWEKIAFRPASIFSTVGLLIIYFIVFCLPFVAFISSMVVSYVERKGFADNRIVEYQKPDGYKGLKEQVYFGGKLDSEIEVDPQSYLYHGKDIRYRDANTVLCDGAWSQGRLHGTWRIYDNSRNLVCVTAYNQGDFVSRKEKVDGQWIEKKWEDLPFLTKWRIRRYQKRPRGPTTRKNDL